MSFFRLLSVTFFIYLLGLGFLSGKGLAERFQNASVMHPRLFLSESDVEAMRARVVADPTLSVFAESVIQRADALLSRPLVARKLEGRRMLEVSRECFRRLVYWGMAFHLTGDDRYAKRAELEMLGVAAFENWNPGHFLDVAEMTAAMGISYDWFYHSLGADSRATIQHAISDLGLKASLESDMWWLGHPNNWNQVCHGGLVIGALATFEASPELSLEIVERALGDVEAGLSPYAPDGAYPEGPGYWAYGTSYSVMMMAALESVLGSDFGLSASPGFLESAGYLLHSIGPSGRFFNYSDSGMDPGMRPELYWFAGKLDQPELVWWCEQALQLLSKEGKRIPGEDRLLPLLLVWRRDLPEGVFPHEASWSGGGENPVAFHRTAWGDPKATFVGLKGGSPGASHGHMDVGQFVMESEGVRWAVDLGVQSYYELETAGLEIWGKDRWKVFRFGNQSHSVLVVDEAPQVVEAVAPIIEHTIGESSTETLVDVSDVYAGQLKSAQRGIVLNADGMVRIADTVETLDRRTEVCWAMVTFAEVLIQGPSRAELSQDGRTLRLEVLSPANVELEVIDISEPRNDYDAPNPGAKRISFTLDLPGSSETRIVVKLTSGK